MLRQSDEKRPVLSICIPTYNRPVQLQRLLSRLLPQLTEETELIIRDDSPNQESRKIFDELISSIQPAGTWQYFQGEKIGLDAANLFLLEKAEGDYFWWFSDDDEMLPGAIGEVFSLIRRYPEIDAVWINFGFEGIDRLGVDFPDGFFKDGSEALEVLGTNIGLLSTYFLRREVALVYLPEARKHVKGFSFASTFVVISVLAGPGKFYFLRGPNFICYPTTTAEVMASQQKGAKNEGFNVYGVDFYNIIREFSGRFRRESIRKILSVNFGCLWRGMLVAWIGGWDTPKGKRWRMFKLYWSFPEFWLAICFFLMPVKINSFLYRIYKIFFSHRRFRLNWKKNFSDK